MWRFDIHNTIKYVWFVYYGLVTIVGEGENGRSVPEWVTRTTNYLSTEFLPCQGNDFEHLVPACHL